MPYIGGKEEAESRRPGYFSAQRTAQYLYDDRNSNHYTVLPAGGGLTYTAEQVKADFPTGQVKVFNTNTDLLDYITVTTN